MSLVPELTLTPVDWKEGEDAIALIQDLVNSGLNQKLLTHSVTLCGPRNHLFVVKNG
jgi:hypothetical protein